MNINMKILVISYALRPLDMEERSMSINNGKVRDFEGFSSWLSNTYDHSSNNNIEKRKLSTRSLEQSEPNYFVLHPSARSLVTEFRTKRYNLLNTVLSYWRWFDFDTSKTVNWYRYSKQLGLGFSKWWGCRI